MYLVAAMAILYGTENGPEPSPEYLAVMFLAGNEYLSDWSEPDSRELTNEEKLAAELGHAARFNTYPDPVRELARVSLLYSRATPQGPLSAGAVWSKVQSEAFGTSFEEFFSTFVTPLQFEMQRWGTEDGDKRVVPVIEPKRWYVNTAVPPTSGETFIDALTVTRETAQAKLHFIETGRNPMPSVFLYILGASLDPDASSAFRDECGTRYQRVSRGCRALPGSSRTRTCPSAPSDGG